MMNHNLSISDFIETFKAGDYFKLEVVACDSYTGFYAFAIQKDLRFYITSRKFKNRSNLEKYLKELKNG